MDKMPPTINDLKSKLPTAPTEEQSPIQNINSTYSNAVIPKKNLALFFGQYTWRDETSKFPGRIQLKTFPGAKANQLSHYVVPTLKEFNYDCAIIRLGINDIFRSKGMSELKDLPKKIMQIATTCQCFKIGKVC